DIWSEAYKSASRAYGTAGTAPFGTAADLSDFAGVLRILEENGAPKNDLQLVLGHDAMANLRGKQSTLFKVNEAGSPDMLRNGEKSRAMGVAARKSAPCLGNTSGTGADGDTDGTPAVGAVPVPVDTGTGTVLAGDIVTFAGDTNKYVVNTAVSGGNLVIGK